MVEHVSDDEIEELIREKAAEHNVPPELLLEIYSEEREVVNMDRRSSILQDVRDLLMDYVEVDTE